MNNHFRLLKQVYVPLEKDIVSSILRYLWMRKIEAWRSHSGPFMPSKKGVADITGLLPGSGRRLEIEVKRPGEKPTEDQAAFLKMINDNNGVGFFASSVEEVASKLQIK